MLNKTLKVLAATTSLTASVGSGMILGNAVKAVTPANAGRITKIVMTVGGWGIGTVLGEAFDKKINTFLGFSETSEADTPKE